MTSHDHDHDHDHDHGHHGTGAEGESESHGDHDHHDPSGFRDRFWIALVLTLPVVIWSGHVQELLGYAAPEVPGARWIPPVGGTLVFLAGGIVFLRGALGELRKRLPGMMTLISLAIGVAFLFSAAVELGAVDAQPLWWELATLVTIMLLGHWIEMRSISQAQGALDELARLLPDTATRIDPETEEESEVPVSELEPGDRVRIRPGESVPADGVIRSGDGALDESVITGESKPVRKSSGDEVVAGTINGEGALVVEVTETGDDTRLSGIMRLVSDARKSRSRAQHLADRAARLLTGVALASGVVTFLVWHFLGAELDFSIIRTVTVLVIACPHALGLAVPLVVAISTTLGAQNGLLVRDRRGLEEARELDVVVFDKTGTLTLGEHRVLEIVPASGREHDEVLALAAAVESGSEHPIARGILRSAEEAGVEVPGSEDFRALPGRGVAARIDGSEYLVGGPALLAEQEAELPQELQDAVDKADEEGRSALCLLQGSEPLAVLVVADRIREESLEAVRTLLEGGLEVVMLTGDAEAVARQVASELGIERVFAQVLPEDKAQRIQELQEEGKRVAMVGDGVNDAPALATADIGIAIGAGTDVAVEAGHIVLVRSDPRDIPRIIALSRATYRKMVQNLWWAAGYNIGAIPLAAGVLATWGILLTPAVGAVLMSASTIIVALNAQLLRRVDLDS